MTNRGSTSKKDDSGFPIKQVTLASMFGVAIFFLFLIAASAVSLKSSLNQSLYFAVGLVAGAFSGLISGFIALKFIKEKGIVYGAAVGIVQSLVSAIIVFILNDCKAGNGIFFLIGIIILFSSLGGILAVNIKKKIKY